MAVVLESDPSQAARTSVPDLGWSGSNSMSGSHSWHFLRNAKKLACHLFVNTKLDFQFSFRAYVADSALPSVMHLILHEVSWKSMFLPTMMLWVTSAPRALGFSLAFSEVQLQFRFGSSSAVFSNSGFCICLVG